MAISADIEILERKWQENPTGLLFAPLAEAHRKAGQWERALEILEAGLAKHADYVPALIVRGRCQLDAEDMPGAEATFLHALERDPVNPIALRGIAEVLERTGRRQDAIARLEFLLEVDRGDSDARAALARLLEPPPVEPAPAPEANHAPDPVAEWAPSPMEMESVGSEAGDADPEPVGEPGMDLVLEDDRNMPVAAESEEPVWQSWNTWEQWGTTAEAAAESEPADAEPAADSEPADAEPEALAAELPSLDEAPVAESMAEEPVAEAPIPEPTEAEAPVMEDPVMEESVVEKPVAEESGIEEFVAEELAEEPEPELAEPEPTPLPFSAMQPEPVEETELVITESMAELFLRQGHHDLALAVYRQLVVRGDHPHLEETVARMEADRAPEPAPEELSAEPEPAEAEPAPAPSRAAAVTGGQRVDAFLRTVLDAPPPAGVSQVLPPAIERGPKGAPTRASEQPLTLAAVFGGGAEEPGASAPSPVAGAPVPEREVLEEAAVPAPSYDEFFAVPPSAPAPSSREPEPAQAAGEGGRVEVEDLKQFNDWLRGLQR